MIIGLLQKLGLKILIDKRKIDENVSFKKFNRLCSAIYLIDDTIENNIIFGRKIKKQEKTIIKFAFKFSQLDKFIKTLPKGINTIVGNNGALSGGQKQRIYHS